MKSFGLLRLLPLFVLLTFVHVNLVEYACDDAYIHFRIAENFVRSGVPYYDVAQPLYATTSLGWTLVLSLCFLIFGVKILPIAILNAGATTLAAGIWSRIGRRHEIGDGGRYFAPVCVLVVVSLLMLSSLSLMETPLFLVVLGLALDRYMTGRATAFVFYAFAVFFRPEGSVFALAALLHALCTRKMPLRSIAGWLFAAAAPFVVLSLYYFHGVVPQTLNAKRLVYQLSSSEFFQVLIRHILGSEVAQSGALIYFAILCALIVIAIMIVPREIFSQQRPLWLLMALPAGLVFVGYAGERVLLFPWYPAIFFVPLLVTLLVCVWQLRSMYCTVVLAFILAPFVYIGAWDIYAGFGHPEAYSDFLPGARVRQYRAIGAKLHEEFPGARLLSSEIGALGYGFKGSIVDACGLVTPGALRFHPMKIPEERASGVIGAIPVGLVESVRPELIVSMDVFMESLKQAPIIQEYDHREVPLFPAEDLERAGATKLWRSSSINIYVRKGLTKKAS